MKSYQAATYTTSNSVRQFNIASNSNFIDAEFHSENQDTPQVMDLYYKYEDEPDFDCEFLHGISYEYEQNESSIDSEYEEELIDEYNDNQWDTDIYDPYLESTYF